MAPLSIRREVLTANMPQYLSNFWVVDDVMQLLKSRLLALQLWLSTCDLLASPGH